MLFHSLLIQFCLSLAILPKTGLVAALIASSVKEIEAGMPFVAAAEHGFSTVPVQAAEFHSLLPEVATLSAVKEITKHDSRILDLFSGAPQYFIDELSQHLYTLVVPTAKSFGNSVQERVAEREAERLLTEKFQWMPDKFKPKTKEILEDRVSDFISLVCAAKFHNNPKVRKLGNAIQKKVVSMNPNPMMAATFFNSVCKIKSL
jgi:hypothetical protein